MCIFNFDKQCQTGPQYFSLPVKELWPTHSPTFNLCCINCKKSCHSCNVLYDHLSIFLLVILFLFCQLVAYIFCPSFLWGCWLNAFKNTLAVLYIKQIIDKDLLYSTGNSIFCNNLYGEESEKNGYI